MKSAPIFTGLDIGSSKVSCVVAEIDHENAFRIIAQATHALRGFSRSELGDLAESVEAVHAVLGKVQEKIGRRPENIYVNINGLTVKGSRSSGMIPLALRGREVARPDMERVGDVAGTIHLPYDREIIHRIVQHYSVDDQPWIKNPLGLFASRLGCEVYLITAGVNHLQNLHKCVNNAGSDIREVVYTGIADSVALLTPEEKNNGAMLLDIGALYAGASFFCEGALAQIEIWPVGTEQLKNGFKDHPGFNELAAKIGVKIKEFIAGGGKVDTVVLAGGVAFADGIIEFLEEKLDAYVKVGVIHDVRGEIAAHDSIKLATACGLARYGYEKYKMKKAEEKNLLNRVKDKVIDLFNNYF